MPLIFASLSSIMVCSEGQHICPILKLLKRVASSVLVGDTFSMPTLGLPAADGGQQASIKRSLSTVAAGWLGSARLYRADGCATTAQFDLLISEPGEQQPAPFTEEGAELTSKVFAEQQLLLDCAVVVLHIVAAGAQQPVGAAGSNTSTAASLFGVCSSPQQLFIKALSTIYCEE
ncbi:hypothetical protein [Pseudomonas mandelii]|uniref:Uncharacterized protein n=1 Tax=Pseudomonas mandelii TaxID=75612 RepID=A0AB36D336_9PSED|nr:hypothetical protein [Pseudomonas mandelii]NMZ82913.1 hypothetical protein [Pseudomonas mandelii]